MCESIKGLKLTYQAHFISQDATADAISGEEVELAGGMRLSIRLPTYECAVVRVEVGFFRGACEGQREPQRLIRICR